ncbi:MAG: hypothetical protein ABFS05_02230 [Bacteroidota bacterium]
MKNLLGKENLFIVFMALVLMPLFFINVRDSHDWGGDFAMYIMQAGNIVNGIPQVETHYIYNPDNAVLGPPAYPVGFPLILSPVYALFGNSIFAFTLYMTAFLLGIGMVMTIYLRRYFNVLITFFLVLIFIYNPWTLNMKLEIMSEFSFTLLLLLSLWLFEKYASGPFWVGIIIAVLGGLLMSVRAIGVIFPLAVLAWAIRKRFIEKDKSPMSKCVCGFLVSVGSFLFYLLFNNIIFNIPQAEGGSYAGIWGHETLYTTIVYNLAYYTEQFKYFFSPWGGSWNFLPLVLKALIFTFTLLGMLRSFFKRLELMDMMVILYLGVLLIYPYRHAGIRFLFPLMPFLLMYLARGVALVNIFPTIKSNAKTWFLGSLVLVSYLNMFWYIVHNDHKVIPGPQEQSSIEAFEYIENNTASDDVIVFAKPRVLALYTERFSMANHKESGAKEINEFISQYGVNYVLIHHDISDEAIKDFVLRYDMRCEQAWDNEKFVLYRMRF